MALNGMYPVFIGFDGPAIITDIEVFLNSLNEFEITLDTLNDFDVEL